MAKEVVENSKLIAVRVPPGDNWELVIDKETVIEGLVQTLTQYMRKTKFKGHYRLEPLNGKLFAIVEEEINLPEPEPEVWDLYGEYQGESCLIATFFVYLSIKIKVMRTKLINFLLDKKSKGLPMNIGEAMSKLNITGDEGGSMGKQVIVFRQEWEKNNK